MKPRSASQPQVATTAPRRQDTDTVVTRAHDVALMERIASGDKAAFAEFLTRYLTAIVDFAQRYLAQRVDAEDVAQEAFIRVWRKAPGWRAQQATPRSWLYRITYHLCIDALRRRYPHRSMPDNEDPVDPEPTPEENVLRRAHMERLDEALRALPERQRTAITLCAYRGLANKEAAAALDITVEALESLLARGRRQLRQLLRL